MGDACAHQEAGHGVPRAAATARPSPGAATYAGAGRAGLSGQALRRSLPAPSIGYGVELRVRVHSWLHSALVRRPTGRLQIAAKGDVRPVEEVRNNAAKRAESTAGPRLVQARPDEWSRVHPIPFIARPPGARSRCSRPPTKGEVSGSRSLPDTAGWRTIPRSEHIRDNSGNIGNFPLIHLFRSCSATNGQQTGRQADRQTGRQADRQTGRQADDDGRRTGGRTATGCTGRASTCPGRCEQVGWQAWHGRRDPGTTGATAACAVT